MKKKTKRTIRLCVIQNKQWRLNGLQKGKRSTIHNDNIEITLTRLCDCN